MTKAVGGVKVPVAPVKTEAVGPAAKAEMAAPVQELAEPLVAKDGVGKSKERAPAKDLKNQELDAAAQQVTAEHAKARGLGFGVTEGTQLPGPITKVLEDAGPQLSGDEMAKLIDAFDKAGTPIETVVDQVLAGTGAFAGGKHEVTLDALSTLIEQFTQKGPPMGATQSQQQEYLHRFNALSEKAVPKTTAADGEAPAKLSEKLPQITPELVAQSKAAVGEDKLLSNDELEKLTGPMRSAAEQLRTMGGPDAQITAEMLTIATARLSAGLEVLPNTTGLPAVSQGQGPLELSKMSMFELARQIANSDTYSPMEQQLLATIKDPQQRAVQELQMMMQKQALISSMLTNLANMRHEMMKSIAMNLRG